MPSELDSSSQDPIQPGLGLAFGLTLTAIGITGLELSGNIESIGFQDPSDPGPQFFPRFLLSMITFGGAFEICRHLFYFWNQKTQRQHDSSKPEKSQSDPTPWIDLIGLALAMSCMVWIIPYGGFPVSASLFLLVFFVRYGIKWPAAVCAAAGIVGVIWIVFVWGLNSPLPRGSWW